MSPGGRIDFPYESWEAWAVAMRGRRTPTRPDDLSVIDGSNRAASTDEAVLEAISRLVDGDDERF